MTIYWVTLYLISVSLGLFCEGFREGKVGGFYDLATAPHLWSSYDPDSPRRCQPKLATEEG